MTKSSPYPAGRLPMSHQLVLGLLYFFLVMDVFTGPLRFYLSQINLPFLVYLPKILFAGVVIATVLRTLYRGRTLPLFGAGLAVIVLFSLVGWIFTSNSLQPIFWIYSMLPLVYAVLAEPILRQSGDRIFPFVALLWCSVAMGVVLDYYGDLPWTGLTYQLGDVEIKGSREWTTFGTLRIAGFARASYEAADQLLILALPLIFLGRSKTLKLSIWLITGTLIYLTTTKKTGGTFLILTVLISLIDTAMLPLPFRRALMSGIPFLVAAIGIGLPVSTLFVTYQLNLDNLLSQILFASFEERLTIVWPACLALALEYGSAVLGRGIGGIGIAQSYFEPTLYCSGDNFFVYLYVTFGVLALAFIWIYVWNLARLEPSHSVWSRMMWTLGITVLLNGWANNCMESPITAIILGISITYATIHRPVRTSAKRMALRSFALPQGKRVAP